MLAASYLIININRNILD